MEGRGLSPGPEETVRDSDITGRTTNRGQGDQRPPTARASQLDKARGPDSTMDCWLFCSVALCLLAAGESGAPVGYPWTLSHSPVATATPFLLGLV